MKWLAVALFVMALERFAEIWNRMYQPDADEAETMKRRMGG